MSTRFKYYYYYIIQTKQGVRVGSSYGLPILSFIIKMPNDKDTENLSRLMTSLENPASRLYRLSKRLHTTESSDREVGLVIFDLRDPIQRRMYDVVKYYNQKDVKK